MEKKKGKVIVVGGSIAGVSCAHALHAAGWEVVVVEKAARPTKPKGSPTGAGLGIDPQTCDIVHSWVGDPTAIPKLSLPLTIDENQAPEMDKKLSKTLGRDKPLMLRAAHWADVHDLLHASLPAQIEFLWGHHFLSFHVAEDKSHITVNAKVAQTGETVDIVGDLLIAADGSSSTIRNTFLPGHKLRYAGYCAWRGVFHYAGHEDSETIQRLQKAYPNLGRCMYFEMRPETHCLLYELANKRMNWLWYVNQPEPEFIKGRSLTAKVSEDTIEKMHQHAEQVFDVELAGLIKSTPEPFINAIYDCDPLDQLYWDRVVLVGDAAHPTTPHCSSSTNMSILDANVLGKCLEKWGLEGLESALEEYQSTRLPVVSKQVLFSRQFGRIKQGLSVPETDLPNV